MLCAQHLLYRRNRAPEAYGRLWVQRRIAKKCLQPSASDDSLWFGGLLVTAQARNKLPPQTAQVSDSAWSNQPLRRTAHHLPRGEIATFKGMSAQPVQVGDSNPSKRIDVATSSERFLLSGGTGAIVLSGRLQTFKVCWYNLPEQEVSTS